VIGVPLIGAPAANAVVRPLELLPRNAWGAAKRHGPFRRHQIETITIHHSAVPFVDNTLAADRFQQHQNHHFSQGFPDISYHLLIDRNGNLYRGRPIRFVGSTATEYDPTGHLLILVEGDFDSQQPSHAQLNTLIRTTAWGCQKFGVAVAEVDGHRDNADTTCPGASLYRKLRNGSLTEQVQLVVDSETVPLVTVPKSQGRQIRAQIAAGTR